VVDLLAEYYLYHLFLMSYQNLHLQNLLDLLE
jgi:hypothetical protein